MSTKKKPVDTKKLQAAVSDFTKLYSLDMNTPVAIQGKQATEIQLIDAIKAELNKYSEPQQSE